MYTRGRHDAYGGPHMRTRVPSGAQAARPYTVSTDTRCALVGTAIGRPLLKVGTVLMADIVGAIHESPVLVHLHLTNDIFMTIINTGMGSSAQTQEFLSRRGKGTKGRRGRPLDPLPGRAERQTRLGLCGAYQMLLTGARNHPGALPILPNYA